MNGIADDARKALSQLPEGVRGMFKEMEGMLQLLEGLQDMFAQNGVQGVAGNIPDGTNVAYNGPDLGAPQAQIERLS